VTWNPLTQPADKLKLKGVLSPGLCEIVGASSGRKWDELAGYAMSGALLVYRGIKLSHFTVKLKLLTDQDWVDWAAFRPLVMRPPIGPVARTLDIYHPQLDEVGIHHCVIEEVHQPVQDEDGVWIIEIACIESRVHKKSVGKPDAAEATPNDPRDDYIGELKAQRDVLATDPGNP